LLQTEDYSISVSTYDAGDLSDWHCHENSFLAFILRGGNLEKRQQKEFHCQAGTLLFYPRYAPHRNAHYQGGTKILHLELMDRWFAQNGIEKQERADWHLQNVNASFLAGKIMEECSIHDQFSPASLSALLTQLLIQFARGETGSYAKQPRWVRILSEIIYELPVKDLSLPAMSRILDLHPVTLSKEFPAYFNCQLGDFIRKIKIERSISCLADRSMSISQVAFLFGFCDSSHYIKRFKEIKGVTPAEFRKNFRASGLQSSSYLRRPSNS
jgi:AraC family transcriptional regulator